MSQLQDNLNEILRQKTQILTPSNVKAGVEYLGLTGTYGGPHDSVKLFQTINAMNTDPNMQEDDIAMVYSTQVRNPGANDVFDNMILPETITLSEPIYDVSKWPEGTSSISCNAYIAPASNTSGEYFERNMSMYISKNNNTYDWSINVRYRTSSGSSFDAYYNSNDGLTFTGNIEQGEFGTLELGEVCHLIKANYGNEYNIPIGVLCNFFTSNMSDFQGPYKASYMLDDTSVRFPSVDELEYDSVSDVVKQIIDYNGEKKSMTSIVSIYNSADNAFRNAGITPDVDNYIFYAKIGNKYYALADSQGYDYEYAFYTDDIWYMKMSYNNSLLKLIEIDMENDEVTGDIITISPISVTVGSNSFQLCDLSSLGSLQTIPIYNIIDGEYRACYQMSVNYYVDGVRKDVYSIHDVYGYVLAYGALPTQYNLSNVNQLLPGYTAAGVGGSFTGTDAIYDNIPDDVIFEKYIGGDFDDVGDYTDKYLKPISNNKYIKKFSRVDIGDTYDTTIQYCDNLVTLVPDVKSAPYVLVDNRYDGLPYNCKFYFVQYNDNEHNYWRVIRHNLLTDTIIDRNTNISSEANASYNNNPTNIPVCVIGDYVIFSNKISNYVFTLYKYDILNDTTTTIGDLTLSYNIVSPRLQVYDNKIYSAIVEPKYSGNAGAYVDASLIDLSNNTITTLYTNERFGVTGGSGTRIGKCLYLRFGNADNIIVDLSNKTTHTFTDRTFVTNMDSLIYIDNNILYISGVYNGTKIIRAYNLTNDTYTDININIDNLSNLSNSLYNPVYGYMSGNSDKIYKWNTTTHQYDIVCNLDVRVLMLTGANFVPTNYNNVQLPNICDIQNYTDHITIKYSVLAKNIDYTLYLLNITNSDSYDILGWQNRENDKTTVLVDNIVGGLSPQATQTATDTSENILGENE